MSAENVLRETETRALGNNYFVSHVTGKNIKLQTTKKKGFSAVVFVTIILGFFLLAFSSGNLIPSVISDSLIEATDVQYADAVESKIIVFQQALLDGNVPKNTAEKLKENNVLVGYINYEGNFVEGNDTPGLVLKMNNEIIAAEDFANEIKNNVQLYDAFNKATYGRVAYYYDESANQVFKKIGTNRNNYSKDEDFVETTNRIVGKGSDINVNNVTLKKKIVKEGDEEKEVTYYDTVGENANSKDTTALDFINLVNSKNTADNSNNAALSTASTLNTADTISKEQKSSLIFLAFMENISKMKVGEGNEAKVNEVMNYLYDQETIEVVDVETGEVIEVTGSMVESPSMYAILSGERINVKEVKNYSSDRVLKTIENRIGASNNNNNIVASTAPNLKGSIGKYENTGTEQASSEIVSTVAPTIAGSLINNSFEDIKGIGGGEILVEGAVNVGKELAKASGATAGDSEAVKSYARLNSTILAMDAKVDRMNRSPFDITSKNTFLGSIVHKVASLISKPGSIFNKVAIMPKMTLGAISALLPATYADDESDQYLENSGDCETIEKIGAVGSPTCSMVATFDISTLDDIFNDPGFIEFIEANTTLKDGVRTINENSVLADFIKYNDERQTPIGVMDGGILDAINDSSSISFLTDILSMIETSLGSSDNNKKIASGEAFVNSSSNIDWQTYKYAQRYVSLSRATAALRQYDGDDTAYSTMKFFEGSENPVIAFLNNYYNIANR